MDSAGAAVNAGRMSAAQERRDVGAARAGDALAMERLFAEHRAWIAALARRVMAASDMQDDLIQAGAIGLMRAVSHFDEQRETRLNTYAFSWILGEMKAVLRAAWGEKCAWDELAGWFSPDAGQQAAYGASDWGAATEGVDFERLDLRRAVEALPPEERQIVYLRYYRDQTQAQTAQSLGKSQAQVSRLERRALDRLRDSLV